MLPTISQASALIRGKKLTAVDLLGQCLERIDALENTVRAWVFVAREEALADAADRDAETARGLWRGPLHGIPIGVKDIIDVFDWPTACGSARWKNAYARQDAPAVQRLRDAGAVLLGKTVTTEYASFDPSPTRNPWNLARTPGGSSSGSAAAVATGMCLAALATQTGGSITRPASYCGVASIKPSYMRASLQSILPLAPSLDHLGTMARDVRGVALTMQAISDAPVDDWSASLGAPSAPVLGRLRGFFEQHADAEVRKAMDAVWQRLADEGAQIEDVTLPASFADVVAHHRVIMAVEAAQFHEGRLRRHPEDYGPNITSLLREGLQASGPAYARAREYQARLTTEMHELLESVDAVLCPATTRPAPDAATTGDPAFNSPWSLTGLPVVGLPVGLAGDGLPLGVQLAGGPFEERTLFQAAAWVEDALHVEMAEPPAR